MYGFDTVQILGFLVSVVLPVVVAFITKESWSSTVKAVLLPLLAVVTSVVTEALHAAQLHNHFAWQQVVMDALFGWVTAVAIHYGLWKPTGVSASVAKLGVKDGSNTDRSVPPSSVIPA